jgi:mannitol-1-/sugar-/sorbitol-6-phosphatase
VPEKPTADAPWWTPAVRAVAFDLDGTLMETTADSERCWRAFFAGRDIILDERTYAEVVFHRRGVDVLADLAHLFPGETAEDLLPQVWTSVEWDTPKPVPGAVEVLPVLRAAGVRLALVTSGPDTWARDCLLDLGLYDLFEVRVTAEQVSRGKPDPEGYRLALARLALEPTEVFAVEDSPIGVAAAKAAGLRCLALTTSTPPAHLAAADALLPDLHALGLPG